MTSSPGDHAHAAPDSHASLHHVSPEDSVAAAVTVLRARGERMTAARRAVLEALAGTPDHLSADQVVALLESTHPGVHRATVYRTLDVFDDLGVVSHVHTHGAAKTYHFAASPAGHEHLHAHCRVCGGVTVIPIDSLDQASHRVRSLNGFRIEASQSTLAGVCADCIAAGSGTAKA